MAWHYPTMDARQQLNHPDLPTDGISTEDHVVWGGRRNPISRVEWGFVVVSWLACLLLSAVIAAIGVAATAAFSETPILGETNTELGVLTVISAMSTFIGFAVMMSLRLTRVSHDRLSNSVAVAVLHIAVAATLFLAELGIRATVGESASSPFDGTWTDELGNAFTVLERSAVAALLACLLAAGMVPARGDRPDGTQREDTVRDRQL